MAEVTITNTEGLPYGSTKVILTQKSDFIEKKIYNVIYEIRNAENEKTMDGSVSYTNQTIQIPGEDDLVENNYDSIKAMTDQQKIEKLALDAGWISE